MSPLYVQNAQYAPECRAQFESSPPVQWNDVAILTLEDDVSYSSTIQPICLATGDNSYVNSRVTVAGWGTLTEGGQQPASLMKVS